MQTKRDDIMENYSKTREQGHLSETSGLSDTGFQAVSVRTLTRQVPDFDTSASGVCQPALPLHRCGGCHRLLPAEAFYADRQGRVADHYCKECRQPQEPQAPPALPGTLRRMPGCRITGAPLCGHHQLEEPQRAASPHHQRFGDRPPA